VRAGAGPSTTPFQATSTALGVVEARASFRRERNPKYVLCYSRRSLVQELLPEFLLCLGFRLKQFVYYLVFPGGSDGKESACNAGAPGSILSWEYPLEKEMATHSSILAWEIPWTEEPGRLQSMRSQRVRHD